jgi:nitrite reductase/ring-hydroxylating ferredoxin subunit
MRTAVLVGVDAAMARRLANLDAALQLEWVDGQVAQTADVVVLDLGASGAVDEVGLARKRWPAAIIAGYLSVPDPDTWVAAQRAGCDLVANRGALPARLSRLLSGAAARQRSFPVLAETDLAGRLGLVGRVEDTPVGPVAIFAVDGTVHAIADRCPHAGARLSDGALQHRQLTCPRHGSQFDVCTGERTRGPADEDIATFRVVVANGQVAIILADETR